MYFLTESLSEVGGRKINQDDARYAEIEQEQACWVMADGLGGHWGGEVASKMAAEQVLNAFYTRPEVSIDVLRSYLDAAHEALLKAQEDDPELATMRTTIVVLVTDFQDILWAHVGDSRLYHFRKGVLHFQTKDHSVPQVLVNTGELDPDEIRLHPDRSKLLRALGAEGDPNPTFASEKYPLQDGDAFLLCTDGFWEYVYEAEMEEDLRASANPEMWLQRMVTRVLERAEGNFDNYTAMAVMAVGAPKSIARRVSVVGALRKMRSLVRQAAPPASSPRRARGFMAASQRILSGGNKMLAVIIALMVLGAFTLTLGALNVFSPRPAVPNNESTLASNDVRPKEAAPPPLPT